MAGNSSSSNRGYGEALRLHIIRIIDHAPLPFSLPFPKELRTKTAVVRVFTDFDA